MRELVDVHYPDAACIRVVQDNLSTHSAGALYEAFSPGEFCGASSSTTPPSMPDGIHPFLNESSRQTRLQWIAALDKIEALNPSAVVAGHKIPANDDSPRNVEETRQYIRDFIRLNDVTKTARELYAQMLELYPDRANPGSLWSAAAAAKSES
jgi:hypothetical protein